MNAAKTLPEVFPYTRWSSIAQTEGDSERRQLTAAANWCSSRGLKLSEKRFTDAGVSAKSGRNLEEGALGELVRVAKPGDVLLIEDNDRFSRQAPITALANLKAVVDRGMSVVFMRTGVEVNRTNFNDMSVIVPNFFGALLANQENEKRAMRIKQSWEKRYAELRSGKATRMKLPGWLKRDGDKVVLDEAKAAIVRRVFQMAVEGKGGRRIAETLNREGVPTLSGHGKWNGQSLRPCILQNRAAIGEYEMKESKKLTGEILKGIYPPVVDEKTFYAVQVQRENTDSRKSPARAASACLVTGLVHCQHCGGPMTHLSNFHSETKKSYRYLVCSAHKVGAGSHKGCSKRISYDRFEANLLGLLSQADRVKAALGQAGTEPSKLAELRGRVASADKEAEKLLKLIDGEDAPPKSILAKLKTAETLGETLRAELMAEEQKLKAVTPPQTAFGSFQELSDKVKEPEYRERVKQCFRDLIAEVRFITPESFAVQFKDGAALEVTMG